jgi:DNA-binding winged helix-turn-helix (wHTH) protein
MPWRSQIVEPQDAGIAGSRARIGRFELDLRAGELWADGESVRLQEQPFRILRMLLQHEGEIVTREEIRRELWADGTIVDFDHSINTAIRKLRLALNDLAHKPRYLQTIARRGYRLLMPAQWLQCQPSRSTRAREADQDVRQASPSPCASSLDGADEPPARDREDGTINLSPGDGSSLGGLHQPRVRSREQYVVVVPTRELQQRLRLLVKLVYGTGMRSTGSGRVRAPGWRLSAEQKRRR